MAYVSVGEENGTPIELYYQDHGSGPPVILIHGWPLSGRSWEPQVRAFDRLYRCLTYSHRGFPPSSVPTEPEAYSQDLLIDDLRALLDHLTIQQAHFVGFSISPSSSTMTISDICEACMTVRSRLSTRASGSSSPSSSDSTFMTVRSSSSRPA